MSFDLSYLDFRLNSFVEPFSNMVFDFVFFKVYFFDLKVPFLVLWLVFSGVFFTIKFKGIQFRKLILGFKYLFLPNKKDCGDITKLQALFTAISGTVGIGNIGGVAIALVVGGPGATLWMIIGGLLGMAVKFLECSLAVMYRENSSNSILGGPMVYLSKGLGNRGFKRFGKHLGLLYSCIMIVACMGVGNMFQSNQAFSQIVFATGNNSSWFVNKGWLVGLILSFIVGYVLIGGIKSIVKITDKIVPSMLLLYIGCSIYILVVNYDLLYDAILLIFKSSFNYPSIKGGFLGVMVIGFQRAFFSNEAGIGSSAIVHSAAITDNPTSQGLVGMLEPFIDTVIICSLTALVIITASLKQPDIFNNFNGVKLTSYAFSVFIHHADLILSAVVLLFAFSTLISWSYYGLQSWQFIFGKSKFSRITFQTIFCIGIVIGSMISLKSVVTLADSFLFALCVPNIIGLYILSDDIKNILKTKVFAKIHH